MYKSYFVYIMSSKSAVLYIGVTSNLEIRVQQHKLSSIDGFTKKYKCDRAVGEYDPDPSIPSDSTQDDKGGWIPASANRGNDKSQ
ncbi:MAG: GIY-YIG nuclease family protein [Patescibacteria group bacterium]|nr:GIY-YIG nuclease family protein [Patescibacteria group bacterium]